MGIPGAAIATVLAVCIQLVWTLSESIKQNSIKIKVSYLFHTDKTIQKDFNRYTLPIVGNLFKQQRKALQQSELVILMRPQVVSDEVWLNELRKSAQTFKELR